MQFTIATVAALAGAATAAYAPAPYHSANGTWGTTEAPVYTTEVVTAYTTYCPEATEITHGGVTYTATEATTLTITNCPCTVTKPATSSVVTACSTCAPATYPVESTSSAWVPYPSTNGTTSAVVMPTGTGVPTSSPSPSSPVTGGAEKVAAAGAGILAVFGLVAAL